GVISDRRRFGQSNRFRGPLLYPLSYPSVQSGGGGTRTRDRWINMYSNRSVGLCSHQRKSPTKGCREVGIAGLQPPASAVPATRVVFHCRLAECRGTGVAASHLRCACSSVTMGPDG